MTNIVDRRSIDRHKSSENRKRFIDRNRQYIRQQINKSLKEAPVSNPTLNGQVRVKKSIIGEPSFRINRNSGDIRRVLPGNKQYNKGDSIPVQKREGSGSGDGGGGNTTDIWDDNFNFILTRDEFLDLMFEDFMLPNFIKKSLKSSTKMVRQRAGYCKEGIPAMLAIKKTFENAIARRIASRAENRDKKSAFLDDIDLRYKRFENVQKPDRKAVMFCVMDVSGSMDEHHKLLAKKFFILLNLFLTKVYKNVELVFVKHQTEASEVNEFDFFYSRETGGTMVSSALELVNKIIDERYPPTSNNIYIAQASDGDNWVEDNEAVVNILDKTLLHKVQYMAYINTLRAGQNGMRPADLAHIYKRLELGHKNIKSAYVGVASEIYSVLKELFHKGGISRG